MSYKRRDFIKLSASLGSGILISSIAGQLTGCNNSSTGMAGNDTAGVVDSISNGGANTVANNNFGIQLYTLRDDMPKDPVGVIRQLASFGYKQIESYEGEKGIFWGMKNTEFKKLMDELGMEIVSAHCDINKDFERKAAEAAEIGMKYLICPYLGPQKKMDDYKKFADTFNQRGEVCKKNGIRFAYHNHDYSFVPLEGQLPQDVMMQGTNKDTVDYEMDIYWVVTAGQDPIKWFDKYPGRFTLCHVKDRKKDASSSDKDASVVVGTGSIDFKTILKDASSKGMRYYIIEQEKYEGTTPLEAAKADAAYMKELKV